MKPPICSICNEYTGKGGSLVYFKETEKEKIINEKFKHPGFCRHPPNAFWFCEKHYLKAKELQNITSHEAFNLMK